MADEDGPPPLEDMSEVLSRISAIKDKVDNQKSRSESSNPRPIVETGPPNDTTLTKEKIKSKQSNQPSTSCSSSGACGFGGMKKGFLSSGLETKKPTANSKPSNTDTKTADGSIPLIKSNPAKANDHLVMQEVQKMREQLQKTDAWLTEDLLNKLGNNDKLMTMMADPRCEKALQEFQHNPDKALITYQHDKYIQEFFREFCDVLGNHYENLHEASMDVTDTVKPSTQAPPTTERKEELLKEVKSTKKQTTPKSAVQLQKEAEEDAQVKRVLSDPQLVEILQSEKIMLLIRSLKEDPEQAQRLLQEGGKEFQEKVKVLVDAGLLAFQR